MRIYQFVWKPCIRTSFHTKTTFRALTYQNGLAVKTIVLDFCNVSGKDEFGKCSTRKSNFASSLTKIVWRSKKLSGAQKKTVWICLGSQFLTMLHTKSKFRELTYQNCPARQKKSSHCQTRTRLRNCLAVKKIVWK